MKTPHLAILLSLIAPLAHAEELSETDRQNLLERLEKISTEANSTVDARFRAAQSAFKAAAASDTAAVELFLKCEELINFLDKGKEASDFREWKSQNRERLTDKGFRTALRQQLRWLSLTLDAASEEPDIDAITAEAARILDSIMSQAEELSAFRSILQQNVTGSVFAKTYQLDGIKVEKWSFAPAQVSSIFDNILLPPLRHPDTLSALRSTWLQRMKYEGIIADHWVGNRLLGGRNGGKNEKSPKLRTGEHSAQYDKFIEESLPRLQWAAEVDTFTNGDQRGSATRMLAHIEKYITHKLAPKWTSDFAAMLIEPGLETQPSAQQPPEQ